MLLLVIRGILLWVLVPVGFVVWLLSFLWTRRPPGQFLGWLDWNLVVLLERSVLRPFFPRQTQNWVSVSEMSTVEHRIGVLDPY
jgi:hypothetical protein